MTYNVQYHAIDGSDGGRLAEGFATVEQARQWWTNNGRPEDHTEDTVAIHEEDGDTYGEIVEELN